MTTRRRFLQGIAATAAALVLPPTLAENAEAARRFWSLDGTMLGEGSYSYTYEWRWDAPRPTHFTLDFTRAITTADEFIETLGGVLDYEGLAYAMSGLFGAPIVTRETASR